jgi:hypothetical protein
MNLSSPNTIIWHYFVALRRLVNTLHDASDETVVKENVVLSVILAVAIVEAFLNVLFRVLVSEPNFMKHEQRVLADLKKRKSLDYKLKNWPKEILGKSLDFEASAPKAFLALKEHRNKLMHFTSSHQTVILPGTEIQGLSDTSAFDSLSLADAVNALEIAESMVCALLRLRGVPEDRLPHAIHLWTGRIPI